VENQPGARIGPPQWSHYKWGHLQMNFCILSYTQCQGAGVKVLRALFRHCAKAGSTC